LCSSHLPLGVPNCLAINHHQLHASHQVFSSAVAREQRRIISLINWAPSNATSLFWRRCRGGKRRPLQGEFFARTSFTLLFVLLYFIYFYLHCFIKNPKKLKSFVVVYYV
jgi:hypothetical protein